MPNSQITLYDGLTGASTKVDAGDGGGASRMKPWLDELSRWLREGVESTALKGLGRGRVANYPGNITGEQLDDFAGVTIYQVVPQTVVLATGDGSAVAIGNEALTDGDRASANYFNTTTDPDDAVAPVGASAPAFLQTISDGAGDFALSATSGILTLRINGELFTVTGLVDETSTELVARLNAFGLPADIVDGAVNTVVRIFAPGNGVTSNIEAVTVAGDAGTVLFTGAGASSQPNVLYTGTNGPLGVMDNTEATNGTKPQRRLLPGSLTLTTTISSATSTATADAAGVITGADITSGSVDHATGVITTTWSTAPDNAAAVTASYKALRPLNLTDPARIPPGGMELALLLN